MCNNASLAWNKAEENLRHYRTLYDVPNHSNVRHEGVNEKYISGSGQPSGLNISKLIEKVKELVGYLPDIILLDLRMESHGYINLAPIEWKVKKDSNLGKSVEEILLDEKNRLKEVSEAEKVVKIDRKTKIESEVIVEKVLTEKKLAKTLGFEYIRLPTMDHARPQDEIVDQYLELIKKRPNAWLHIHCHVGKGRTTTFMALYDMFYNAKQIRFKDILNRHKVIGGEDFKKYRKKTDLDEDKKNLYHERFLFLKQFYQYCKEEANLEKVTWQDWLKSQHRLKS